MLLLMGRVSSGDLLYIAVNVFKNIIVYMKMQRRYSHHTQKVIGDAMHMLNSLNCQFYDDNAKFPCGKWKKGNFYLSAETCKIIFKLFISRKPFEDSVHREKN